VTGCNKGFKDDNFYHVESKGIDEAITEFRVGTEGERLYSYILM
jgi:hypothetical protein